MLFSNIDVGLLYKILTYLPTIGGPIILTYLLLKMCIKLFQFYRSEITRLQREVYRAQRLLEENHKQMYKELKMKRQNQIDEIRFPEKNKNVAAR